MFSYAAKQEKKPVYRPNVLNTLKNTAEARRANAALVLYKDCRKITEADAMHSLNDPARISNDLNNRPLICVTYDLSDDYYLVNRGYNNLSNKCFVKAIAFAQEEKMQLETGIYQHRKANYSFLYKKKAEACGYYFLSEENFRDVGFDNVPGMGNLFSEASNFYYSHGDFDNARQNLRQAQKHQTKISRTRINIINTIGLTYHNDGQYNTSMAYFDNALKMARSAKNTVCMAIATGNIRWVYFIQHNYEKAFPLIQNDYNQSVKYHQKINSAIDLLRLVRTNVDYGKLEEASLQLNTTDKILALCTENVLGQQVLYYGLKAIISDRKDNIRDTFKFHNQSEKLREIVSKRDNIAAIERVRMQWITEKSRQEFNDLKKSTNLNTFKLNTIIVVLALLIIIKALICNRQRLKAKKDKELLASEKRWVDEELKNATLVLNGYTENLTQKNILIDEIKTELENIQSKYSGSEMAENLDKMMQAHIMTEDNWAEFKKLFSRVHNTFFYNLRQEYGNLSGTDVRLLALIKLKLNNREMASMLGISVDGVKKAKQRLRKKMEILEGDELEGIINKL
ncbi:hypothetical protein NAF17_08640 [Mucilaginibacter sp. RB4R14]|uniref:hypothetical protein n=1 Tax=Mucilaginibacter aurantiaciroseus TaxID=2949308 RepID=UPI0020905257|nr:hypothetical protein [Mucilaginibacter aurantiaciroseus]MCO5935606.1 hypothetical protein [Mucilaginibacter aurantiaciroseus]